MPPTPESRADPTDGATEPTETARATRRGESRSQRREPRRDPTETAPTEPTERGEIRLRSPDGPRPDPSDVSPNGDGESPPTTDPRGESRSIDAANTRHTKTIGVNN